MSYPLASRCVANGIFHSLLDYCFVHVVTALTACLAVAESARCRKNVLPSPFPIGVRILPRERVEKLHASGAFRQIAIVKLPNPFQMGAKRFRHALRQHRYPVLAPNPGPGQIPD